MKKIYVLVILVLSLISNEKVKAVSINEEKMESIYINLNYKGEEISYQFGYVYVDNKLAYRIEPNLSLIGNDYKKTVSFNIKRINNKLKEKIELIAYYGYQYKNHNTDNYYFATQALIFEELGGNNISYTTSKNRVGVEIDITKEKEEIKKLVDNFLLLPSFSKAKIQSYIGTTTILEDTNNTYSNYTYTSTNKNTFSFIDNKININLNELGEGQIIFSNKLNNDITSYLYCKDGYQSVVTLGINIVKESYININATDPNRVKLRVNNYDMDNNILIGSAFKIKDIEKDVYLKINDEDIFYTNEEGFLDFTNFINSGKYELQQVLVDDKYKLNNNIIFIIDKNTPKTRINGINYFIIDYYNDIFVGDKSEFKEDDIISINKNNNVKDEIKLEINKDNKKDEENTIFIKNEIKKDNELKEEIKYDNIEKLPKTSDNDLLNNISNLLIALTGLIFNYASKNIKNY